MIIPIRCFTCGKVIADKWEAFLEKVKEIEDSDSSEKKDKYFTDTFKGKILDDLKLTKICCRRHMLGHVDII